MIDISIVGHASLDKIITTNNIVEKVGGPPTYIESILKNSDIDYRLVTKVGKDFPLEKLAQKPIIVSKPTTKFVLKYNENGRELENPEVCEPIYPEDIKESKISIVSPISGEVSVETLQKIIEKSEIVILDIQGFVRKIENEKVIITQLDYRIQDLLKDVDIIKANEKESIYLDIEKLKQNSDIIITKGERGCDLITKNNVLRIPADNQKEVEPTGAGDMFLGGLALALLKNMNLEKACHIANKFGALAVREEGVPKLTKEDINNIIKI